MNHAPDLPSSDDFDRLESQLFERISVRYRRQVVRRRLAAAAVVLVLAGAGVAAGTVANPRQQSAFASCYGGSTTSSRVAQVALSDQAKPKSDPKSGATADRVANALLLCRAAWKVGVLGSSSGTGPFPIPSLQVCLADNLTVSVFRRSSVHESASEFCNNLGLSAP